MIISYHEIIILKPLFLVFIFGFFVCYFWKKFELLSFAERVGALMGLSFFVTEVSFQMVRVILTIIRPYIVLIMIGFITNYLWKMFEFKRPNQINSTV